MYTSKKKITKLIINETNFAIKSIIEFNKITMSNLPIFFDISHNF